MGGQERTWALKSRQFSWAQEEEEAGDLNHERVSIHCFWLEDEGCRMSRNAGGL